MINTLSTDNKKQQQVVGNIVNDIYLLPSWEILKSFSVTGNRFFFFHQELKVNLLYKFVSESMLEKYSIRTDEGKVLAGMDLMMYKDSVYIVNLEIVSNNCIKGVIEKLLQAAVEKAMYYTSEKQVIINVSSDFKHKNRIKRILTKNHFELEENQRSYEIMLLGETYKLKVETSSFWTERINKMPILF